MKKNEFAMNASVYNTAIKKGYIAPAIFVQEMLIGGNIAQGFTGSVQGQPWDEDKDGGSETKPQFRSNLWD